MPTPQILQQWQAAEQQLQARRFDLARAAFGRLVDDPELGPVAHLRLSLIARSQDRYRDSVDEALAAHAKRVPDPDLLEMIAKRLFVLGEHQAAVQCATDPVVLGSRDASTVAGLGKMLSDAMFPEQALQLLERARALGLDAPLLGYLIGLNLNYTGRAEAAQRELEACLPDNPAMASVLWTLARMGRPPGDGVDRVDRLRRLLAQLPADHADTAMLQYALFTELDRRDDPEAAWAALDAGMRARRAVIPHDSAAEQALFDHLGTLGPVGQPGFVTDGPRPVFIVGMPRTGTTLLERVLGNHPDIADAGELLDLVRQMRWCADLAGDRLVDIELARKAEDSVDWAELGQRYLSRTQWRANGRKVYTDKLPPNFLNVAYIARALPQARILHMVRDPMDTCFSNLKIWFAGSFPPSDDQVEMADHFRRYHALMAHWHAAFPGRILDVHYDALVADPEAVAREVLAFCELPMHAGISAIEARTGTVATASSAQVREPVHQRFVGQWRRYESHLGPLRERLGALAY